MKPRRIRRFAIGTVIAFLVIAGTGAWLTRLASSAREREVRRHADVSIAFADSLERVLGERKPSEITPAEATASLYLSRLRLGLGSPFRLIDQALRDPSVAPVGTTALAEAMLARTLVGAAYEPRASGLDLVDPDWRRNAVGTHHQAIIDSVVASTADPRVGELAIRLAYRLATASGALSRRAPELATAAAAQARDRLLAMRDARAMLGAARRDGVARLSLVRSWRDSRRFEVERPVIAPLTADGEREAVAELPRLVARIESLSSSDADVRPVDPPHGRSGSDALASRMATVASSRDLPPIAPVLVAIRGYSGLLRSTTAGTAERFSRARFIERSSNEETLAAEYAVLRARAPGGTAEADAIVLTAAVALRPYAQERAWLRGDNAPTARDLQSRFGIAVTYDATARAAWRPYLHRNLETAIVDMKRVLPGFDPKGLRIHFGESPQGDRVLAMHDPIRRTIYFPPVTSSGVMAHEFAHDLDWQAARREYGGTGWYRTDHALRQSTDRLAGALRLMASARIDSVASRPNGTTRPTEVLARNVDWFVSASLAREGRVNGHLSAAQDPVLTGYASAITPEAARDGGAPTLRALDGITSIPAATRTWFAGLYGAERRLTVHEAVRRVLEAPLGKVSLGAQPGFTPWMPDEYERAAGLSPAGAAWSCLVDGFAGRSDNAGAVRAVMQYAAESRARGVVRQWAEFAERRPEASPAGLRALTGAPWNPALAARTLRNVRDAILWSALMPRWEASERRWETTRLATSGC